MLFKSIKTWRVDMKRKNLVFSLVSLFFIFALASCGSSSVSDMALTDIIKNTQPEGSNSDPECCCNSCNAISDEESVRLSSIVRDQFNEPYRYGRKDQAKFFESDKVNVVLNSGELSIFVQKDEQELRPLFVINAVNNTDCPDEYKAYIRKIVTLEESYRMTASLDESLVKEGSFQEYIADKSASTAIAEGHRVERIFSNIPASEVSLGRRGSLTSLVFNRDSEKNLVCINKLISPSRHGKKFETYPNQLAVFMVKLEMMIK
jgi:hypothetical protein